MDPDKALDDLQRALTQDNYDRDQVRDLFEGLHHWIVKGGFLPKKWSRQAQPEKK